VRYWFKPSGVRNEALDRRVYALAALYARSVSWEVLLRVAPTEPPPQSPPEVRLHCRTECFSTATRAGDPVRAPARTLQDEMTEVDHGSTAASFKLDCISTIQSLGRQKNI
jgi:phage terminase large subunit GpA-like protein